MNDDENELLELQDGASSDSGSRNNDLLKVVSHRELMISKAKEIKIKK